MDLNAKVTIADVIKDLEDEPRNEIIGQVVADIPLLQDPQQTEGVSNIQAEPSPSPLPGPQVVEKYNPQE